MNGKNIFLVVLSVILIVICPIQFILGQKISNVQVKVYDQALNPQEGIDLKISDKDAETTNARGITFIELPDSELPPSKIVVDHNALEVESWNYSRGILEVIIRQKSYREVHVQLMNSETNKPIRNLNTKIQTPDTILSATSSMDGKLSFLLPINQELDGSVSFNFDTYSVAKTNLTTNSGTLFLKEKRNNKVRSYPMTSAEETLNSAQKVNDELSIENLDSITSITVFYSLMKKLNLSALDSATKVHLDERFSELLQLENTQARLLSNPLALISDSTQLSEDIKLISKKIEREESLLVAAKEEFENASQQIQLKLESGGKNLNEEQRDELVQDVLRLRKMLRKNEELFYKNNSYYNLQINTFLNQLADIYELEDKLIETERESNKLREKFLIFFMAFLVLCTITVLLIHLIKIFKSQKFELAKANEEISNLNANLEGLITEKTKNLQLINRELDTFFYRSSHNMRGPITTIKGLANIATITLGDEGKMLFEKVDHTTKGMERMLDKLNMIHQLNRPEAFGTISINEIVEKAISKNEAIIERRNISFEVDVEDGITFNSYQIIISIILNNLIENALYFSQFTREDQSKVSLKVFKDADDELIMVIRDNGCGIREDVIHRIWDMFFIGIEKSKGSGLGLYIARKAVHTINGEISVIAQAEKYAEFKVALPLFLPNENTSFVDERPQRFSVVETERDRLIS